MSLHPSVISFQPNENIKAINYCVVDTGSCVWMKNSLYAFMNLYRQGSVFSPLCKTVAPQVKSCPVIVYPNPSNGNFTVKGDQCVTDYYFKKGVLSIVSMNGTLVYQQDIYISDLNQGIHVSLNNLPQGNYLLHIQATNINENHKIVIAR